MEYCKVLAAEFAKETDGEIPIYYRTKVAEQIRKDRPKEAERFGGRVEEILDDHNGWIGIFKKLSFVKLGRNFPVSDDMILCPQEFQIAEDAADKMFFRRLNNRESGIAPKLLEIWLVSSEKAKRDCGFGGLSCYSPTDNKVLINFDNWTCASDACKNASANRDGYERYAVYHEVGHALGFRHVRCMQVMGKKKTKVPIMEQQTLGIIPCEPNVRPIA